MRVSSNTQSRGAGACHSSFPSFWSFPKFTRKAASRSQSGLGGSTLMAACVDSACLPQAWSTCGRGAAPWQCLAGEKVKSKAKAPRGTWRRRKGCLLHGACRCLDTCFSHVSCPPGGLASMATPLGPLLLTAASPSGRPAACTPLHVPLPPPRFLPDPRPSR